MTNLLLAGQVLAQCYIVIVAVRILFPFFNRLKFLTTANGYPKIEKKMASICHWGLSYVFKMASLIFKI